MVAFGLGYAEVHMYVLTVAKAKITFPLILCEVKSLGVGEYRVFLSNVFDSVQGEDALVVIASELTHEVDSWAYLGQTEWHDELLFGTATLSVHVDQANGVIGVKRLADGIENLRVNAGWQQGEAIGNNAYLLQPLSFELGVVPLTEYLFGMGKQVIWIVSQVAGQ